LRDLTPWS